MLNKKTRKVLSVLLVICMLFTIMPASAFAAPAKAPKLAKIDVAVTEVGLDAYGFAVDEFTELAPVVGYPIDKKRLDKNGNGKLNSDDLANLITEVNYNSGKVKYTYLEPTPTEVQITKGNAEILVQKKTKPVTVKYYSVNEKAVVDKDTKLEVPTYVKDLTKLKKFTNEIKKNVPETYTMLDKQNYKIDKGSVTIKVKKQTKPVTIKYTENGTAFASSETNVFVDADQLMADKIKLPPFYNFADPTLTAYPIENDVVTVPVVPVYRESVTFTFVEVDADGNPVSAKPIPDVTKNDIRESAEVVTKAYVENLLPKQETGKHAFVLANPEQVDYKIVDNQVTVEVERLTEDVTIKFKDDENWVGTEYDYVILKGQKYLNNKDYKYLDKEIPAGYSRVKAPVEVTDVKGNKFAVVPVEKILGTLTVNYVTKDGVLIEAKEGLLSPKHINIKNITKADKRIIANEANVPYGYNFKSVDPVIKWEKAKGTVTATVVANYCMITVSTDTVEAVKDAKVQKVMCEYVSKDNEVLVPNPFEAKEGYELDKIVLVNDIEVLPDVALMDKVKVTGPDPQIRYTYKAKEVVLPEPQKVTVTLSAGPDKAIDGVDTKTVEAALTKDGKFVVPEQTSFVVNEGYALDKIIASGFTADGTDLIVGVKDELTPVGKDLSIQYIYVPKAPVSESIGLIATPSEAMAGSAAMMKDLALDSNGLITVPAADKYFTANKDYNCVKVLAYGFNGSADGQEVKVGDKLKVTHKDPILKYFYEAVEKTVPVNFIAGPTGAVKGTGVLEKELVVGKDGTVVVPKDTTIYSVNSGYVLDAIMATGFNGTDSTFEVKAGTALKVTSKHPVLKYLYKTMESSQEVVMTIGSNQIVVDGNVEYIDTAAVIKDSRTFVPFRALAEAFGADVQYVEANRTVIAKLDGTTVIMTVGSNVYTVNGVRHTMDVAPYISNSRVMVPVRFMAEAFGITVTPTFNAVDGTTASVIFTK